MAAGSDANGTLDETLQLLEGQKTDISDAERTIQCIICDLEKADTIAGLRKILKELKDKRRRLTEFINRLPSITHFSTTANDLQQVREHCRPPPTDVIQKLQQKATSLIKIWDVVKRGSAGLPPAYRLDIQKEGRVDAQKNQVKIVVKAKRDPPGTLAASSGAEEQGQNQADQFQTIFITPQTTTIALDVGPVCVSKITDDKVIEQAAGDVLVFKIDWSEELKRAEELETEKQRLIRQLDQEKARSRQNLQDTKHEAEAVLLALHLRHQEEKDRDLAKFRKFTMKLDEEKDCLMREILRKIEDDLVMSDIIERLFKNFDIRLLAMDSGLRLMMETQNIKKVKTQEPDIQKLLEETLSLGHEVKWTEVTPCDPSVDTSDLQLGQALSDQEPEDSQRQSFTAQQMRDVCVSEDSDADLPFLTASESESEDDSLSDSSESEESDARHELQVTCGGEMIFDPMTAILRRMFVFRPDAAGDTNITCPYITSIVATQDGRLVMADHNNKMVKVADMTNPPTVHGVTLDAAPWGLALLHDGRVAVTSPRGKSLYLVDVSGHPSVVSRVQTVRQYRGVSAGTTSDTLIVGCWRDEDGLARIEVITRAGDVIQTVVVSNTLKDMRLPDYLCVFGRDVLVSYCSTDTVYRVELATGRLVDRLAHPNMKGPHQVASDPSGNVYIACNKSECVLVMSPDGRWRRLLEGQKHGDGRRVRPRAVCVTGSRLVVAWYEPNFYSVVAGYDFV